MCRLEKEESKNMSKAKPKIEGAKKFRRPTRAAGPTKKEFVMKVLGHKSYLFNIGNAKYAAKYKKRLMPLPTISRGSTKAGQTLQRQSRN